MVIDGVHVLGLQGYVPGVVLRSGDVGRDMERSRSSHVTSYFLLQDMKTLGKCSESECADIDMYSNVYAPGLPVDDCS